MVRIRKSWRYGVIGLIALMGCWGAWAQTYPSKPIRLMVGFAPGGSTDVAARILAHKMSDLLGQPVVVENRTGAAGSIAADQVAKAEPDGYRILLLASGTFVHSVLSKNIPYNIEQDFTPIAHVAASPLILVVDPNLPVRNVSELIALARAQPGQLTYGSEGIGGTTHLATELFSQLAKVRMVHVPFKTAVDSTMSVASSQISINLPTLTSALPLLKAEKLRAIAIGTRKRSTLYPAIPTIEESGVPGYDQAAWFGFIGPKGLPKPVVDRLATVSVNVANMPEVKEAMGKQGLEVDTRSPEQFGTFMREAAALTTRLAKESGIKLE